MYVIVTKFRYGIRSSDWYEYLVIYFVTWVDIDLINVYAFKTEKYLLGGTFFQQSIINSLFNMYHLCLFICWLSGCSNALFAWETKLNGTEHLLKWRIQWTNGIQFSSKRQLNLFTFLVFLLIVFSLLLLFLLLNGF